MISWLNLPESDRRQILIQVAAEKELPESAIEKDVWVTLVLEALFSIPDIKDHLAFKGGTSLSKGYRLIDRFSEDIDFAIDRQLLGFNGELSKKQIERKLRPASAAFTKESLMPKLQEQLELMGVPPDMFLITPKPGINEQDDPLPVYVQYHALTGTPAYLNDKVEIEISARSQPEPAEKCNIQSLISEVYPGMPFAGSPFAVSTVLPQRTFLEKIFLLHEQFQRPIDKAMPRNRMSRHLYDIDKLMDHEFARAALANKQLYYDIIAHRKLFNPVNGISYDKHGHKEISFIPPVELMLVWKTDYEALTKNMIGGHAKPFEEILARMHELTGRLRAAAD